MIVNELKQSCSQSENRKSATHRLRILAHFWSMENRHRISYNETPGEECTKNGAETEKGAAEEMNMIKIHWMHYGNVITKLLCAVGI